MAEKQDYSAALGGLDNSKLPLYGRGDKDLEELQKAREDALSALQKRYEQPNWFKVAAGFAKPQLGGFAASLGSAAEALGENVEQQRAQELPIAQMKLAIKQGNMLLKSQADVADDIKKWRESHPGQTPSAQLVGEWAARAPESNTVKSLQEELNFQQKQAQQTLERINHKRAANIPLDEQDRAFLAQKPEGQPRAERPQEAPAIPSGPAATSAITPPKLAMEPVNVTEPSKPEVKQEEKASAVLPSGARVNKDVLGLHQQGIPIISNIRTQKEQDALKHHQDENGNWYTKEGRPVSDVTKHLTGDAIDLDPKKNLNAEQRKLLEENGWKQPNPKGDANHWERVKPAKLAEAKPAQVKLDENKPPQFYPPSLKKPDITGLGPDDVAMRTAGYKKSAEVMETPYAEKMASLAPLVSGNDYTRVKNSYDTAIGMIENNQDMAKKVFAMLRQDPIKAALNEGIGVHAGSITANINLPVKAFLDAGLSEREKHYADKLFSSLVNIATANLRAQGVSMGKVPQQEYMKAMSGFVNPDLTAPAALNMLHHSRADFDQSKEYYDIVMKEMRDKVDMSHTSTPYSDIHHNSSDLAKIHKKYSAIHKRYDDDYQNALRPQGNKP
jgi:hypothetical protein